MGSNTNTTKRVFVGLWNGYIDAVGNLGKFAIALIGLFFTIWYGQNVSIVLPCLLAIAATVTIGRCIAYQFRTPAREIVQHIVADVIKNGTVYSKETCIHGFCCTYGGIFDHPDDTYPKGGYQLKISKGCASIYFTARDRSELEKIVRLFVEAHS